MSNSPIYRSQTSNSSAAVAPAACHSIHTARFRRVTTCNTVLYSVLRHPLPCNEVRGSSGALRASHKKSSHRDSRLFECLFDFLGCVFTSTILHKCFMTTACSPPGSATGPPRNSGTKPRVILGPRGKPLLLHTIVVTVSCQFPFLPLL